MKYRSMILLAVAAITLGNAVECPGMDVDVEVLGVDGDAKKNVLAYLRIYQEKDEKDFSLARLKSLHSQAESQIKKGLQPFGFYNVKVQSELRGPEGSRDKWSARYVIEPGQPVVVKSVHFRITGEGAEDPVFSDEFGMKFGEVLVHEKYENAKQHLMSVAAKHGYLDARFEKRRVVVDASDNSASIEIVFNTGPRYRIGEVRILQDLLAPEFVNRYVTFRQGDPYDWDRLRTFQGNLIDSEYFREVEVVALREEAEGGLVPLEVRTRTSRPNKLRFGLGFATDVGPRFTMDWHRRYIGRYGHKLYAEVSLSPVIKKLIGEYRIPLENPVTDYLSMKPEINWYDTPSRDGETYTVELSYSIKQAGWRRTLGLDFRFEDYNIATQSETGNELVPYASWTRVVSDSPIYTSRGYRLKTSFLGAVEGVLSTASYFSSTFHAKLIRSFLEDYRFVTRSDLGVTLAENVDVLPASRRFFAGGDTSIRGYDLEELGPVDSASGRVVGGRYLAVGSVELERRIYGKWSGALFYDVGNAFDPDYSNTITQGAGFGIRWLSPVGLIRLDLAFALSREGCPVRLHLVVGPDL